MNILFVCLGNICRSPIAEGILKATIEKHNLPWQVESAGTSGYHMGDPPDIRSINVCKGHHIDISDQRSRKVRSIDFEIFDIIFAMDVSNYNDLMANANPSEKHKIKLLMNEYYINENRSVPDPYYDSNGFEIVFNMLELAINQFFTNNYTKK